MNIRRIFAIICILITCASRIFSQTIDKPNHALKSHETLEILKVEITEKSTIVYLVVENRITGGTFCADRNIILSDREGVRMQLRKSSGIPVCPESYSFKGIGEKLQFTLEFPPLKAGTQWVDLIEECSSNCFWFYGVTLDNDLNKKLDEAFYQASKNKPADNVILFKSILDNIDDQNLGIEGLLYINIINAAREDSDKAGISVWYKRLTASRAPRADQYLKYLNDLGIKY